MNFDWLSNNNVSLDLFLVAIYLVALPLTKSKDLITTLLFCIIAQAYCLSPLYNLTLETYPALVFIIYSAIYFTAIRYLSTYKVMVSCFIMALFEIVAYGAYKDAIGLIAVESFVYDNYELLVTFLHLVIINSTINWREVVNRIGHYGLPVLRYIGRYSCSLPYGV